jgi:hypothetical protein
MDKVHLHLLLTHAPIIGYAVGLFFLIFGYITKSEITRKGALILFVILTPVTLLVSNSGEGAEHLVEDLPGVSERIIELHEDAAGPAVVSTWILGAISLAALLVLKKDRRIIQYGTLAATICVTVTCVMMAYAGYLGGQIRHTEIRDNQQEIPKHIDDAR